MCSIVELGQKLEIAKGHCTSMREFSSVKVYGQTL